MAIEIRQTFTVSAPVEAVWAFLVDPAQVVTCMPGAELEGSEDERTWLGNVQVKVGAISARYRGRVRFEQVDEAARSVRLSAEGREAGGGIARGSLESRLRALPEGGTEVTAEASIDLTGRIAQMGRGLIQGVSDQLFQQFVARARERLERAPEAAASPAGTPAAAPAREPEPLRVLPLVLRSLVSALLAWLRRLTGARPAAAPAPPEPRARAAGPSERSGGGSSDGPLAGVRVLDAGTLLAAPYGATLLGDLGADVVKLEPPRGEDSRHLGPGREGERTAFLSLNRNKRSLALDLRRAEARAAFAKLAPSLDVVVTNVREPALSELGLGYEQVRALRPDVVWIGVSAFGPDGPYGQRPGIDFLVQGYAGLLALTGEPEGQPVRVTVPLVDVMTSLLVANAAQAGLLARARTGRGQRIDVSLLDALVHAQSSSLVSWLVAGEEPARTGNRSRYFAPSGIYPTADGSSIVLTCPSQKFFRNACRALEVDLDADPRFATVEARLANQDALDERIASRCRELPRSALLERLAAADALVAPVLSIPEVAADPQVRHNGMVAAAQHEKLGAIEVTGVPIRLHGTPGGVRRAPPVLGQHSRELLAEAGCSADEIDRALAPAP